MPDVAKVLREEITRLARKEVKSQVSILSGKNTDLRRQVSALKKQVDSLEKGLKSLSVPAGGSQPGVRDVSPPEKEAKSRRWITAKGIKSLRKRLKLSQKDLADLCGVSAQTVYQWESKDGALRMRNATREEVEKLRDIGIREARAQLQAVRERQSSGKQ